MTDMEEQYNLLGLQPGAAFEQIKAAYKQKALTLHPDKNAEADATSKFQTICSAYIAICMAEETNTGRTTQEKLSESDGGGKEL